MDIRQITLLGHKDHGKSTLLGNLLMLTKSVTRARINEAEAYSKRLHKGFEPAFIIDSFYEERMGGLTIDITRAEISYKNAAFSFIDVPGHEELIKNMISGASYASTALLLVSVKKDEGIRDQAKRHMFIARMLGIEKLIVVVNKMDTIGYAESAFSAVEESLFPFIRSIGFSRGNVAFVPVSAYNGDNMVGKSAKMKWYKGAALIDSLYSMSRPPRKVADGPARMILQGFLDSERKIVAGRMVRGRICKGDAVRIAPSGESAKVKSIKLKGGDAKSTSAGDSVALGLDKSVAGEVRGSVISGSSNFPKSTDSIEALIFVTGRLSGKTSIRFNGVKAPASSVRITKHINPVTGSGYEAKSAKPLTAVEATLKLKAKIPVERFSDTKELGRFTVYAGSKFSGIGIIR